MWRWPTVLALGACGSPAKAPPDAPPAPWTTSVSTLVDSAGVARRLEPGVTSIGTQLVVAGGIVDTIEEGEMITTKVEVLDTTVDPPVWSEPWPDLPVSWTHIQMAAVGTTVYLLGGLSGAEFTAHTDAFRLDTQSSPLVWQSIAPLPSSFERGSAAVIVAAPRIYLLGGAGTNFALATNLYYDLEMDAWCPGAACPSGPTIPDLPAPRSHPAGMRRSDGTLVLAGGLTTLDSSEPDADVFWLPPQPATGPWEWQTKTPMPSPKGGCAYAVLGERMICAGGEASQNALHTNYAYDPNADTAPTPPTTPPWTTLADMPAARAGAPGAAVGQRLFVPGGAEQLVIQPTDTLFIYDALLDTSL